MDSKALFGGKPTKVEREVEKLLKHFRGDRKIENWELTMILREISKKSNKFKNRKRKRIGSKSD